MWKWGSCFVLKTISNRQEVNYLTHSCGRTASWSRYTLIKNGPNQWAVLCWIALRCPKDNVSIFFIITMFTICSVLCFHVFVTFFRRRLLLYFFLFWIEIHAALISLAGIFNETKIVCVCVCVYTSVRLINGLSLLNTALITFKWHTMKSMKKKTSHELSHNEAVFRFHFFFFFFFVCRNKVAGHRKKGPDVQNTI